MLVDETGYAVKSVAYRQVVPMLLKLFAQRGWLQVPVVGSSVGGPLSQDSEAEGERGVSITLGYLPGSKTYVFEAPETLTEDWMPTDWSSKSGLKDFMSYAQLGLFRKSDGKSAKYGDGTAAGDPLMILLGHPEYPTFTKKVLEALDFAYPGAKKMGANAGRCDETHERCLFFYPGLAQTDSAARGLSESSARDRGVVGVALSGNLLADAVVAQGARPIGPNFEVAETELNGTVITKLRGPGGTEGATMTVFDLAGFAGLIPMEDVKAALNYVALGVSLTPMETDESKHCYIVRTITDLQKDGPVCINEPVRVGQTVRFHIRDPGNATQELDSLIMRWRLERTAKSLDEKYPAGALLFADSGRGKKLFGPSGESESARFAKAFPNIDLGGGFFDGVIGELPNFKDTEGEAPLPEGAGEEAAAARSLRGQLLNTVVKATYQHTIGASFAMLYGAAEAGPAPDAK